jgi:ketosteroid isomerase-like protein
MSEENLEVVRRAVDAWNRGDPLPAAESYHPEVEFVPLRAATEGRYRGLSGIDRFNEDTREIFDRFELHLQYEDLGDRVLAWGTIHVRARGSGVETDIGTGGLLEFKEGKIVRWEDLGSRERALEAAGLTE